MIVAMRWEARLARAGGSPMVDLALFKERTFSVGLALSGLMLAMFGGFMLAMTLFLQGGMHMSPVRAGLLFGPLGVAFAASSMLARRVSGRYGARVIAIGAALSTAGLVLLGDRAGLAGHGPGVLAAAALDDPGRRRERPGAALAGGLGAGRHQGEERRRGLRDAGHRAAVRRRVRGDDPGHGVLLRARDRTPAGSAAT